ncbi:MAG TPA: acyltransferase domain-containing protein, partial [Longimicrobium sp.]
MIIHPSQAFRLVRPILGRIRRVAIRLLRPPAPVPPRLIFAFGGGAGAWDGMGRALYRESSVFRESIEASGAAIEVLLGWPAAAAFRGEDQTPATPEEARRRKIAHLGMIQIAQVDLWRAEGVTPGAVLAVSMGERVAPYAAGALTRDDCARAIAVMAAAMSRTRSPGMMFIVQADAAESRRLCRAAPAPLHWLGTTLPGVSVVYARESDAEGLRAWLGERVVRATRTDWAYHTPFLDTDRDWAAEQLRDVVSSPATCPVYAASAGGMLPAGTRFDAAYFEWAVSRPFHFVEAVSAAVDDGFNAFVSIGAKPSASAQVVEIARARGRQATLIESMREGDELEAWAAAVRQVKSLKIAPPATRVPATASTATLDGLEIFQVYEDLRQGGPVHFLPRQQAWAVLGYDEVKRALLEPGLFSSRIPVLQAADSVLVGNDDPEHAAVRKVLMRHFSADALARRARIGAAEAERLLAPLRAGEDFDVVSQFADPFSAAIGVDVLGIDPAAVATFAEPTLAAAGVPGRMFVEMTGPLAAAGADSELYRSLRADGLDDEEAHSIIRLFWLAGTVEIKRMVATATLVLLQNPELRADVRADPEMLRRF